MIKALHILVLTTVALLLGACGGDDVVRSEYSPTGNIQATIEIHSDDGSTAYAHAQLLRVGAASYNSNSSGDEYVDLQDGDSLWLSRGENLREATLGDDWFQSLAELDQAQELFEGEYRYSGFLFWSNVAPSQVHYNGRLISVREGTTFTVSLLRDSKADALDSSVTMPLSFDLLAPIEKARLSRSSDPVIVEWFPTEEGVTVEVNVSTRCRENVEREYTHTFDSDDGYAELAPGEIDDADLSGSCYSSVTVVKVRDGELDSGFAGGSITARQLRSVSITTVD